jgi:hypothetical protein
LDQVSAFAFSAAKAFSRCASAVDSDRFENEDVGSLVAFSMIRKRGREARQQSSQIPFVNTI